MCRLVKRSEKLKDRFGYLLCCGGEFWEIKFKVDANGDMRFFLPALLKKGELPVTCGDEEGTLYTEKLAKGTPTPYLQIKQKEITSKNCKNVLAGFYFVLLVQLLTVK